MATNNQIISHQDPQPNDQNQYHDSSASQTPEVSYYSNPYSNQYHIDRTDRQYERLAPPNPETSQNFRPNQPRYRSPPPESNKYPPDRTTSSQVAHHDHGRPRNSWGKKDGAHDIQRELESRNGKQVRKTGKQEIVQREEKREFNHYKRQQEETRKAPVDRQGESRGDADEKDDCGEKEQAGRVHWRK